MRVDDKHMDRSDVTIIVAVPRLTKARVASRMALPAFTIINDII